MVSRDLEICTILGKKYAIHLLNLVLFVLSFSSSSALGDESSGLCQTLLRILGNPSENVPFEKIVDIIYMDLPAFADGLQTRKEYVKDPQVRPYLELVEFHLGEQFAKDGVVGLVAPGKTLHSAEDTTFRPEFGEYYVLHLPAPGEKTVWEVLSIKQKQLLAESIAKMLSGKDYAPENPANHESKPNVISMSDYFARVEKGALLRPGGIVPIRFLRDDVDSAGQCRHAACALVGILGELGIPQTDIRIVEGYASPKNIYGHAWVEIRYAKSGDWKELDPTPGQELDSPHVTTPNNSRNFPYRIKRKTGFLNPLDIKTEYQSTLFDMP